MIMDDIHDCKTLASTVVDQPISCLEFSPVHRSLLLVGTYHLTKNGDSEKTSEQGQSRSGSIMVFELMDETL